MGAVTPTTNLVHPVPVALMEALLEHCHLLRLRLKLKTKLQEELKEELAKQREKLRKP